jgi:hypothetical protein
MVYQQALLVYLKSSHQSSELSAEGEKSSADFFIPLLQSLDVSSKIFTTLMWPLAVFGASTKSSEHKNIILQSLDSMSSAHAVNSIRETRRLLEVLWGPKGYKASPLSIEAVMKDENMIVLFL